MKCQQCEKPATFHITELTGEKPHELHLCEQCAQQYLSQNPSGGVPMPPSISGMLSQQLKVSETAKELSKLDDQECPICGITFYQFRNEGRLGCPHDYACFSSELGPLIVNIHGDGKHTGKHPKHHRRTSEQQTRLMQLRGDMKSAIEKEDYERASQIRDEIRRMEDETDE